jgi:hypothetical protein
MKALALTALVVLAGCARTQTRPAATQPATAGELKSAYNDYWFEQPAVVEIRATSFDALWNASQEVARSHGYLIDRTDYREGLLYTQPLVSKALFEVWRADVTDAHSLAQSSLATIRRTVRYMIHRQPDGTFVAQPKVVVERYSSVERRITSAAQYHDIFSIRLLDVDREREFTGTDVPAEYWYAIGRDHDLERELAHDAERRLRALARR